MAQTGKFILLHFVELINRDETYSLRLKVWLLSQYYEEESLLRLSS